MHLRDADPVGDLGLGEIAEEPHHHDGCLAFGQLGQRGIERLTVLDEAEVTVDDAELVLDPAAGPLVAGLLAERVAVIGETGLQTLVDLVDGQAEIGGEFTRAGGPAEFLTEPGRCRAY